MKWIYVGIGVPALIAVGSMIVLLTSKPEDRQLEVQQAIARNSLEKAQQLVDDLVFVRRKDLKNCFWVRADLYDGRGWASLDAIVIPVDCNTPH